MDRIRRVIFAYFLGVAVVATGVAGGEEAAAPAAKNSELLSRIDFGNAYVMGQTMQSGAVYLLNRKQSEIRSMLKTRTDFRQEIREDAEVVDGQRR